MPHPPTLSLLLRLRSEEAAVGDVVGHVEVVETGEVVAVRNGRDLANLIKRLVSAPERAESTT